MHTRRNYLVPNEEHESTTVYNPGPSQVARKVLAMHSFTLEQETFVRVERLIRASEFYACTGGVAAVLPGILGQYSISSDLMNRLPIEAFKAIPIPGSTRSIVIPWAGTITARAKHQFDAYDPAAGNFVPARDFEEVYFSAIVIPFDDPLSLANLPEMILRYYLVMALLFPVVRAYLPAFQQAYFMSAQMLINARNNVIANEIILAANALALNPTDDKARQALVTAIDKRINEVDSYNYALQMMARSVLGPYPVPGSIISVSRYFSEIADALTRLITSTIESWTKGTALIPTQVMRMGSYALSASKKITGITTRSFDLHRGSYEIRLRSGGHLHLEPANLRVTDRFTRAVVGAIPVNASYYISRVEWLRRRVNGYFYDTAAARPSGRGNPAIPAFNIYPTYAPGWRSTIQNPIFQGSDGSLFSDLLRMENRTTLVPVDDAEYALLDLALSRSVPTIMPLALPQPDNDPTLAVAGPGLPYQTQPVLVLQTHHLDSSSLQRNDEAMRVVNYNTIPVGGMIETTRNLPIRTLLQNLVRGGTITGQSSENLSGTAAIRDFFPV